MIEAMSSADQPYRGDGTDRPTHVPLPPDHLSLFRSGQLRKSWHYVSFWSSELSFCVAQVNVGPLRQEYWGVWDRAASQFRQGSHTFGSRAQLKPNHVKLVDGDVLIDVGFANPISFEVYRPAARAYIWSHKDYSRSAQGTVRYGATNRQVVGVMFVDVNAGYHERHTHWRWAAGAGKDQNGRLIAFNAITGLFDTPTNSERTIWVDETAREVGPNRFADDLRTVSFAEGGELTFDPEQLIEHHDNYLVIRSDYFHWFGTFRGTLPGGIELKEAYGVRERHDAVW